MERRILLERTHAKRVNGTVESERERERERVERGRKRGEKRVAATRELEGIGLILSAETHHVTKRVFCAIGGAIR